jgi:hypothetical protein
MLELALSRHVQAPIQDFFEAYKDDKGTRYRYAVGPMSIYQLEVRYKDDLVWSIVRRSAAGSRSREYYAAAYIPEPGEMPPE